MSWVFQPWPADEAATFVARPVSVTLANRANRQGAFDPRRHAMARYTQPVVKAPLGPLGGILIQYVRRPQAAQFTRYQLHGPTVVVTPLARPIEGYLTPTRDRNPPQTRWLLRGPVVVNQPTVFIASPIKVVLADSLLRIRKRPMHRLWAPNVVNTEALSFGPGVRLAPQARGVAKSRLSPPAVVTPIQTEIFFGPNVTLAPSSRGKAKPLLPGPAVIGGGIAYGGPRVKLTNPLDRVPATMSRLAPPTVVATGQTFYGPKVTLARIRPRRTLALLLTVPDAFQPVGKLVVHLAADSPRGKAKPKLYAPTVVQTFRIPVITVTLAPQKRGVPKSILRKPVDLVDQQDVGSLLVWLAYSRRGAPKSKLRAPTVVAPVLARAILVSLAPSSRGKPKPHLSPPTVVFPFIARPTDITLVRIRPVATRSILRKPTDLVDAADLGYLRVHLAYSLRGKPKSRLSPPAVVAPVLARAIDTTLVRIRPVRTVAVLHAPTVVFTAVELSGPEVTLTRIRPPRTMSILREPIAGAAQLKAEYDLRVWLAYSRRGKPKSKLRAPVVVTAATPYFRREPTALVRIRPRRTLWILRKPVVAAVVAVARPTLVSLAPSTRGRVRSVLRPPALLPTLARPTSTFLAYSRRGRPYSVLSAPAVVTPFVARPTAVHLAPSARGIPKSTLRPPAVVGAGIAFYGPNVTLVRIRPQLTHARLAEVIGIVPPCFGVGTSTTRPTAENEISTEASAENVISTEAGASAAGTTAAGSTMEGSTRPSAENVIGDEQREGC